MRFTKIPADTFQKLQLNAGIIATDFTPATGAIGESGQIGATTGGISFNATPTYSDFGEDIDNCPNFIYLRCGFLRKNRQTWRNTQFPTAYACKCS